MVTMRMLKMIGNACFFLLSQQSERCCDIFGLLVSVQQIIRNKFTLLMLNILFCAIFSQIFHVCLPVTYPDGQERQFRWSFICPEETMFNQVKRSSFLHFSLVHKKSYPLEKCSICNCLFAFAGSIHLRSNR